ncbi:MAG: TrkH family potassium uptake protein [Omnitrophica WOR_2 bacterium]
MNRVLHLKVIARILGINLIIISIALVLCSGIALIYSESILPFIYSAITVLIPAVLFLKAGKKNYKEPDLNRNDAYFTVTVSWLVLATAGTLPYLFSGSIPSFVDALFESVSGFSTTGASILTDIEALPYSILFWRSLTHWIGGIGIIILVIIVMPSFKIGGYHLFTLESSLQQKMKPRTKSVGYRLLLIYVSLTVLETIMLLAGGMNLFESVCHSFGTVATGGFSPKNDSINGYSPYIQYVIMLFMLLAGVNFALYYYAVKREFSKIKENNEFRFYLLVVFVIGLILTLILIFKLNKPVEQSFRDAFFTIISIITCTGFVTADYLKWPVYAWIIVFYAMFLGGSTGSTSGSIKMVRHLILFKNIKNIFRKLIHPNAVLTIRINKKPLPEDSNFAVLEFIKLYLIVFTIGSTSLILMNLDIETSCSAVATCMAGIGPGLGTVGPVFNFYHLPAAAKIVLSIMMILGRLEIYTVLILFTRSFWQPRYAKTN